METKTTIFLDCWERGRDCKELEEV
jgi:hypothetical protein